MINLGNSHPDMFNHMLNQGFTVSLSGQPFTQISCDQVTEMTIVRQKALDDCQEKEKMLVQVSVGCELTM